MVQPKIRKLIVWIVLPIVILSGCKVEPVKEPLQEALQARAFELREVLDTIENIPKEPPRIFRTDDAYVRFMMAPPSTHFAVDQAYRDTPQVAAGWFLNRWRNLFVNESPAVEFNMIRVNTTGSRSYVRYRQKFAGIEVYGAQMNFQINASCGVVAVMSDIMRDTKALETGSVSLDPALTPLQARDSAIAYLVKEHQGLQFEATDPNFMIFDPHVVGWEGEPKPVWHTIVGAVDNIPVKQGFLIDAHTGEIAFSYNLAPNAINRQIWDANFSDDEDFEKKIDDGDLQNYPYPSNVLDANLVYVDVNEVYDFYKEHHKKDDVNDWLSYDGDDSQIVVSVRYCKPSSLGDPNYPDPNCDWDDAQWLGGRMYFDADYVFLDLVGHEFTHGVTENTSNLTYGATESGAINESFSDMWAAWIEGDWTIAEDDPNYGPWRNMANPHDPNAYSPGPEYLYEPGYWDEGGEPHTNCSVGNYLCNLITTNLGADDAADLFWECQYNLLQPSSDYYDLGNYLQLAAINLGFSAADRDSVEQACRTVEIYTATSVFSIGDVAWFDDLGNLILTGTFTSGGTCTAPSGSFIIKNSVGETVAYIDSAGNMCIEGGLHENQETLTPPSGSFIVGSVGYINQSGHLYLKRKLYKP